MNPSHNAIVAGPHSCFSASCKTSVRWGISSSVETKNPDGSPLTLYACDEHEPVLTARLRAAKTRYRLVPVQSAPDPSLRWVRAVPLPPIKKEQPAPTTPPDEAEFQAEVEQMPTLKRHFLKGVLFMVGVVITPAIVIYYGIKWLCGWRPSKDE